MKHTLPNPSEDDVKAEIIQFYEACLDYHIALKMKREKLAGHWYMFEMDHLENNIELHFEEALRKLPTLFCCELEDMLKTMGICYS